MINIIWLFLITIGLGYSIISGANLNDIILSTPKNVLYMFFEMAALIIFWSGILEVASEGGCLKFISKKIKFLLYPLFREIPKDHVAFDYIAANIAANFLGLGSASTPMGLKAMKEMQDLNENKEVATNSMVTLLVFNTTGLTLIPTSILAMRKSSGANITVELIPYILAVSLVTTIIGLMLDKLFRKKRK